MTTGCGGGGTKYISIGALGFDAPAMLASVCNVPVADWMSESIGPEGPGMNCEVDDEVWGFLRYCSEKGGRVSIDEA